MAKTSNGAPRSTKPGGAGRTDKRTGDTKAARARPLSSKLYDDTPMITAFRWIRPHWWNYLDFVGTAARNGDKDMDKILKARDALTERERRAVTPERLCELAGVRDDDLVARVCGEIWRLKRAEGSIVTAMAYPKILDTVSRNATKAKEYDDRELFFRVTGALPDKKGTSVVIQNNPQTLVAGAALPQFPKGDLLDMDEEIIELGRDFSPAKFLTTTSMPLVVEEEESDDDE